MASMKGPAVLLAQFMRDRGWLSEEQDQSIQSEAKAEIDAATQFAEESPWPSVEEVTTDVVAPIQEVA